MKAFTIMVPHVPSIIRHPIHAFRLMKMYNCFPGMLGVSIEPEGLLMVFSTVPHAERAQVELLHKGYNCGRFIMNADVNLNNNKIQVHDPVDGWPEGWCADA